MSYDWPVRPRARLFCDGEGCGEQLVAYGDSFKQANANLAKVIAEAQWQVDGLDKTFAEATLLLGEKFMKATASEILLLEGTSVRVTRNDLCPTCRAKQVSP